MQCRLSSGLNPTLGTTATAKEPQRRGPVPTSTEDTTPTTATKTLSDSMLSDSTLEDTTTSKSSIERTKTVTLTSLLCNTPNYGAKATITLRNKCQGCIRM